MTFTAFFFKILITLRLGSLITKAKVGLPCRSHYRRTPSVIWSRQIMPPLTARVLLPGEVGVGGWLGKPDHTPVWDRQTPV